MDLWLRLLLCGGLLIVAGYATYSNRSRDLEAGQNPLSFLLDAENFSDWGRLWRIVTLVLFLAVVGVATMKMVATLLGGPIIDLDQFR